MVSRECKINRMFGLHLNCKSVVKTVFGGEDDSAQKAQIRQNAAATQLIAEKGDEAAQIANQLFPAADVNRNLGFQAALDVLGQSAPQQFSAFQQGNVGAQQALLAGQQQQQNALLGLPVNMSSIQPQAVQFDPSFLQQQLPEFTTSTEAMAEVNNVGGLLGGTQQMLVDILQQQQQRTGPRGRRAPTSSRGGRRALMNRNR